MLCNWFTLLFQFSMALFYLIILMNAKMLKSVYSRFVHGIPKHSTECNTELIRPKLSVVINMQVIIELCPKPKKLYV
jgi:hypothetical protein